MTDSDAFGARCSPAINKLHIHNKQICTAPYSVVTSEALGPGSVLVSRGRRESLGKEGRLYPRLDNCNRVTIENNFTARCYAMHPRYYPWACVRLSVTSRCSIETDG